MAFHPALGTLHDWWELFPQVLPSATDLTRIYWLSPLSGVPATGQDEASAMAPTLLSISDQILI